MIFGGEPTAPTKRRPLALSICFSWKYHATQKAGNETSACHYYDSFHRVIAHPTWKPFHQ